MSGGELATKHQYSTYLQHAHILTTISHICLHTPQPAHYTCTQHTHTHTCTYMYTLTKLITNLSISWLIVIGLKDGTCLGKAHICRWANLPWNCDYVKSLLHHYSHFHLNLTVMVLLSVIGKRVIEQLVTDTCKYLLEKLVLSIYSIYWYMGLKIGRASCRERV